MTQSLVATILDGVTSKKGALLLVPAILLVGATLAIGKNSSEAARSGADAVALLTSTAKAQEAPAGGAAFSDSQRKAIEAIIKDYLLNNPELMLEVNNVLEAKMDKIQAERMAVAVKENADELFRPTTSPIAGNSKGDVTMIEFFDYNCGYCKKAFGDVAQAIEKDKQVKLVLKEFPILSKGSEEAARVALAAKMQGKYWEFHRAMLESQGQANEASALKVAEKLGLDMTKLKKDMASAEVKKEIDDTRKLATKMGIQGTPHFIVGDRIIPGAPENLAELLGKNVADVRKEGCKVC
ncbi:MAG TPA: DsbA family protein [Hyphomicrobiaceae bacterium]|jgi:protein-disulfide isomerase|nr:DsbA family protein [Hyphomicrobiaceae bacterium]